MTKCTAIIAIDPGNIKSAITTLPEESPGPSEMHDIPNDEIFGKLRTYIGGALAAGRPVIVAIEQIRSYGMAVGATIFDTVHWSGRFHQYVLDLAKDEPTVQVILVPRRDVKMHLCHTNKAKDVNVNTALADKYGGMKVCKGTKANPGPLYGIAGDMWAALALAVTVRENLIDGKYLYDKQLPLGT